jgi:hypothetical protein
VLRSFYGFWIDDVGAGPLINPVPLDRRGRRPNAHILALIPTLPIWDAIPQRERGRRLRGAQTILHWLQTHPGDGWQDRWLAAGPTATHNAWTRSSKTILVLS